MGGKQNWTMLEKYASLSILLLYGMLCDGDKIQWHILNLLQIPRLSCEECTCGAGGDVFIMNFSARDR